MLLMSTETILSDTIQVVTFTIANKSNKKGNYAVPIEQVKEIKIVDAITKIPKSKSYVKGIMNLRGKIIPIVDVNGKIGTSIASIDESKQRILVADVNDTLTGLLVDEVNEVRRLNVKEIEPAPAGAFEANYIKGIATVKDNLIVLLDVAKFLEDSSEALEEAVSAAPSESPEEAVSAAPSESPEEAVSAAPSESPEEAVSESTSTENDEGVLPEIEEVIKQETQK
jgi:purine-binding chemotaxis protein CheW